MLQFTKMHPDVREPSLGTPNSIGADLHAYLKTDYGKPTTMAIGPGQARLVPTGLVVATAGRYINPAEYLEIPTVLVLSRSGLATKGIFVANAPGLIDPDYRGEVKVILFNGSPEVHWVQHNDRIAQLLVVTARMPLWRKADYDLREEKTTRGEAGFGSTGA